MKGRPLSGWRKVASALWSDPRQAQIDASLAIDATAMLEFIARARAAGTRVTATHLVGRAVAHALVAVPELNVRLIGARAIPRRSVDVFFITAIGEGHDLSGVKIADVDRKSARQVAAELQTRAREMKAGVDPDLARAKKLLTAMPRPLLRASLRFATWLAGGHDVALPWFGVPRSPFGSAMISSVGMLDLPMSFSPLTWMYRVPVLMLVGPIAEQAVVRSGRVLARPMLPITASIDHRYADGAELARALAALRAYLESPTSFEAKHVETSSSSAPS